MDLRKFPAAKGAIKVLRVATSTGEVHAIRLKLVYGATLAQNSAGAKVLTVPPEAKPATTSTAPAAAPSQPSTSITANPPSSSSAVSVAKPALAAPPQPPSHSTETQQSGRAEQPVSSVKVDFIADTGEGGYWLQAANRLEADLFRWHLCGHSCAEIERPIGTNLVLKEHLRSGLRADPHRFPDLEDRANRLETLYKKATWMDLLKKPWTGLRAATKLRS